MQSLTTDQIIENDHRSFVRLKRRVVTYAILWTAIVGFVLGFLTAMIVTK